MNKINFTNLPSTTTPVNASNLNLLQDNVDNGKLEKKVNSFTGDYNNLTDIGFYYADGNSTNGPSSGFAHYVTVYKSTDNYIYQVAYRVTNTDGVQYIFVRQKYNGTWTGWLSMARDYIGPVDNNADYNTFTTRGTYFSGGVPTGSNRPPVEQAGLLEVFVYGAFIVQRYTSYTGSTICARGKFSTNAWGGWKKTTLS